MVPLAVSGPLVMGVVIVGALILLTVLLRDDGHADAEERPPDEL
jgi:hypothetical protein